MFKKRETNSIISTDIYFSTNGLKAFKLSKIFRVLKLICYFSIIFLLIFGLYRFIFNDSEIILFIIAGCFLLLSFVFYLISNTNAKKSIKNTLKDLDEFYKVNGGASCLELNKNHRTFVCVYPKTNTLEIFHDTKSIFKVNINDISNIGYVPDISKKNKNFEISDIKGISAYSRLTIEYTNKEKSIVKKIFDLSNYMTIENQLSKEISKEQCKDIYKFHREKIEKLDDLIKNAKKGIMPISSLESDKDEDKNLPFVNSKKDEKIQRKKREKKHRSNLVEKNIEKTLPLEKENNKTEKVEKRNNYIKSSITMPEKNNLNNQVDVNIPDDIKNEILRKETNREKLNENKIPFDK